MLKSQTLGLQSSSVSLCMEYSESQKLPVRGGSMDQGLTRMSMTNSPCRRSRSVLTASNRISRSCQHTLCSFPPENTSPSMDAMSPNSSVPNCHAVKTYLVNVCYMNQIKSNLQGIVRDNQSHLSVWVNLHSTMVVVHKVVFR